VCLEQRHAQGIAGSTSHSSALLAVPSAILNSSQSSSAMPPRCGFAPGAPAPGGVCNPVTSWSTELQKKTGSSDVCCRASGGGHRLMLIVHTCTCATTVTPSGRSRRACAATLRDLVTHAQDHRVEGASGQSPRGRWAHRLLWMYAERLQGR
jgi:hypothetical protein